MEGRGHGTGGREGGRRLAARVKMFGWIRYQAILKLN